MLGAVVALVVADQTLIQPLLLRMNGYAPAISVASRQRMLSQKLAKAAQGFKSPRMKPVATHSAPSCATRWRNGRKAHESLQRSVSDRGVTLTSSPAIDEARSDLKLHFTALHRAFAVLASGAEIPADKLSVQVETIMRREPSFLLAMDRLVVHMETLSAAMIQRLRFMALAVAGTIVALISALGWFVIRPATLAIQGQINDPEHVVARPTCRPDDMPVTLSFESAERESSRERNQALAAQLPQNSFQGTPGDAKDCIPILRHRDTKKLARARPFDGYGLAPDEARADLA